MGDGERGRGWDEAGATGRASLVGAEVHFVLLTLTSHHATPVHPPTKPPHKVGDVLPA